MTDKSTNNYTWDTDRTGKISVVENNQYQMRDLLDKTGKGFCLAKWTQVTMHLGNGLTHSCHHPTAHTIPLNELKENPGALHNTNHKKEQRRQMLNGKRPSECDFCWRVEDNNQISDRVFKSMDEYSFEHHDKINELDGDEDIYPTYVEVSFSRTCNLKCAYCGPAYSSQWHQEIKSQGPYDLEHMKFNIIKDNEDHIPTRDDNPYVDAFWEWFPDAYKHMHTFRITGGEPLLIKDTWKVIDFLMENPNPNLNFAINSNGVPPEGKWEEFVEKVNYLQTNKCVKSFVLFTSAEAAGERNDYIRYGMDYVQWQKNIEYFLANTEGTGVTIMAAFNLLSITSFKELLEWVLEQKQNYNFAGWDQWLLGKGMNRPPDNANAKQMDQRTNDKYNKRNRVLIDTPYVRAPAFLDASIATTQLVEDFLIPALDFVFDNIGTGDWKANKGFDNWEALKLRRNMIDIANKATQHVEGDELTVDKNVRLNRGRFFNFIKEYDKRRNVNFLEVFPEFESFYKLCEREHETYHALIAAGKLNPPDKQGGQKY